LEQVTLPRRRRQPFCSGDELMEPMHFGLEQSRAPVKRDAQFFYPPVG
jgi:hypothetical protein